MTTKRQEITDLLKEEEYGAKDLSRLLGLPEKAVYDHLTHVARSVAAQQRKLVIIPARCIACDFTFRSRGRYTRPGRCPRCRSGRITEPRFHIR